MRFVFLTNAIKDSFFDLNYGEKGGAVIEMTRKEVREQAFILIFENEFNNEYSLDEMIEAARDAELFETDAFARELAEKTIGEKDKIDVIFSDNLKGGWKLNRISKVSLAILRLALCEMTEFPDIPVSVSINEAVDLAKKYAPYEDYAFVNGLLSSVNRGLNSND